MRWQTDNRQTVPHTQSFLRRAEPCHNANQPNWLEKRQHQHQLGTTTDIPPISYLASQQRTSLAW